MSPATPWYRRKLFGLWRAAFAILGAAAIGARWLIDGTASLVLQAILFVVLVLVLVLALRRPKL